MYIILDVNAIERDYQVEMVCGNIIKFSSGIRWDWTPGAK